MPKLQIENLSLKNIRCFKNIEIEFEEGTNIITGPNGSGKSTILTAIGYGLFGANYLYGLSYNSADLIKRGEIKGSIKLEFVTDKGRYRSVHHLNTDRSNSWKIYQPGIRSPITETITDSRELVYQALETPIDYNIFKNAICSVQGQITQLLDISPAKRKDQIRKILNLDNFDVTSTHLGKFIKRVNEETRNISSQLEILKSTTEDPDELEKELNGLHEELEELGSEIDNISQKITELDEEYSELQKLLSKKDQLQKNISNHQDMKEGIEKEYSSAQDKIQSLKNQLEKETISSIDQLQTENQQLKQKIETLQSSINKLEIKISNYNSQNKRFEELRDNCIKIKENLHENEDKLEDLVSKHNISNLQEKRDKLLTNIQYYSDKKEDLEQHIDQLQSEINSINSEMNKVKEKISTFEDDLEDNFGISPDELDQLFEDYQRNCDILEQRLKQEEEEKTSLRDQLVTSRHKMKITQQTLKLLQSSGSSDCPICSRPLQNVDSDLLDHHQNQEQEVKSKIKKLENQYQKKEDRCSKINKKLNRYQSELDKLKSLKATQSNYHDWQTRNEQLSEQLQNKETTLKSKHQELSELKSTNLEELQDQLKTVNEVLEQNDELQQEIKRLKDRYKQQHSERDELKQKLDKIDIDDIKQQVEHKKHILNDYQNKQNILAEHLIPQLQMKNKILERKKRIKQQLQEYQDELHIVNKKYDPEKKEQVSDQLNQLREELGGLQSKRETILEDKIPDLKERLDSARTNKKKISSLQSKYDNYTSNIKPRVKNLRKIIDRVPNRIIENISDNISQRMTQTIKRLLPNRGYNQVKFKPTGDIELYNDGTLVQTDTLSGGEKTVLGLAVRLALADYIAPLNFMILDEPTTYLDRNRVIEFVEIVDRENVFQSVDGQLILVTHRSEFDRNAQKSIQLTVTEGKRKIRNDQ